MQSLCVSVEKFDLDINIKRKEGDGGCNMRVKNLGRILIKKLMKDHKIIIELKIIYFLRMLYSENRCNFVMRIEILCQDIIYPYITNNVCFRQILKFIDNFRVNCFCN